MGSLTQRAGIGEQREIGGAVPGGAGPGDQPDQRVGLQVIELDVVALGCSTRRSDGGVEDTGDAGIGLRIDLQMRVAHPADPIHPAPHAALLAQPGHPGHPVVTRQGPTQLAHLPLERLHRHHDCRLHDRRLQVLQLGPGGVIQLTSQAGHSVDVTGRQPPRRQRVVHLRQLETHRGSAGRRFGVTGGATTSAGQQARGRLTRSFGGEP